jgi:hypothetical protein
MKLYHCTQLKNVDDIIRNGLKTKIPLQRENKPKGIYLSTYKFNWMWNTQRSGFYKGAVIEVNVDGLDLIEDFHEDDQDLIYNSRSLGQDYICLEDITPDRIMSILIEKNTNEFHELVGWKKYIKKKK